MDSCVLVHNYSTQIRTCTAYYQLRKKHFIHYFSFCLTDLLRFAKNRTFSTGVSSTQKWGYFVANINVWGQRLEVYVRSSFTVDNYTACGATTPVVYGTL